MVLFLLALTVSLVATLAILRSSASHERFSGDNDRSAQQKVHARIVPRVGGIGIALGTGIGMLWATRELPTPDALRLAGLGAAAALAFAAGLAEDLTKRITPAQRLLVLLAAAALGLWLAGIEVVRIDVDLLDPMLAVPAVSVALTLLAVAGVSNSINIIDGFNGLASMCVGIMFASLAYVAFKVGDPLVLAGALAGLGAVLGFFVWNYPLGLIFLGDGGAYFLGFWVAELSLLLVQRNEGVSPLFPLLLCAYPIFETLFSMYRRRVLRGLPMGQADATHLHSLIYRRLMRWAVGRQDAASLLRRNSMTSPYLWLVCSLTAAPAVLCWDETELLAGLILAFCLAYLALYRAIVRFRTPRLLVRTGGHWAAEEVPPKTAG